ncbi:D-threo-3-hydroxyaspartate dehydratase [Corynebacterium atrinae]|uniref:alanine racemase n=1 Tax=Corynebacterium atrinae TaxID=1336740 RepID=UPI0025B4C191|nr:alanine racemase [Corynebacterium atrinae]WJY64301.1 D-threo-3-hydroxyaspartate dehydratase [Corynebacterium atrinae]
MTPIVRIDLDRLRANIASMAASEIPLRPHVKTHKIPEIARLQLAAGARGLTVATVGEAEVFAEVADDIFIAYPVWADDRLAALSRRVSLTVGCDSVEAARRLSLIDASVPLLIEIDSGHHRSGVPVERVGPLARQILDLGLEVRGAFTFPGHSYQPGQMGAAAEDEAVALSQAGEILRELGIRDPVLSGGSTPSARVADASVLTELRPGVYVFNDAQQLELGTCGWEDIALTVRARVISRRADLHQVILDAGSKILSADRPAWASGFGRIMGVPDARLTAVSEHHGTVAWPTGEPLPTIGEEVDVVPNHVCPVLNLVDEVEVSDGSRWVVAARGKN